MQNIYISIETFCNLDLKKVGVYRYVQDTSFAILLFAYSIDGGLVNVIDLALGQTIPDEIINALMNPSVSKWAFNAQFERICLSLWLKAKGLLKNNFLAPESWFCSQVMASYMGLPPSLSEVGKLLHIRHQKMKEGTELVKFFCSPCKPSRKNGNSTRNAPSMFPIKWAALKMYNAQDVKAEMEIRQKLAGYNLPNSLWDEYHLDQEINDRGIAVDTSFVNNAISIDEQACSEILAKMKSLTGLDNPNSTTQMKLWLSRQGINTASLDKSSVANIIESANPLVKSVLSLWQQLKKTSVEKFHAMKNFVSSDNRARGMLQFYGASRTGRWSSKGIQLHNLPQNHLNNLEQARQLVASGNFNAVKSKYDDVRGTLSQVTRTSFVPAKGYALISADFSAIEARVLARLSEESWRQKVFANNGDIYSASASRIFGVNVVKNGENGHLRAKGKVAELALGYGGSENALKAMGALDMGISENELSDIVQMWRATNPNIVNFWYDVENAAACAINGRSIQKVRNISFISSVDDFFFIELPSGRRLSYPKPRTYPSAPGHTCITYEGFDSLKNK